MTDKPETYEKVAEVLAETIREAAKLAGGEALSLAEVVEKRGDALVEKAEDTARKLRDVVDRLKGRMKAEMKQLSEEIGTRSEELAETAVAYIRHCEEASRTILEHHKKLNGAATPTVAVDLDAEMKNLAATAMRY